MMKRRPMMERLQQGVAMRNPILLPALQRARHSAPAATEVPFWVQSSGGWWSSPPAGSVPGSLGGRPGPMRQQMQRAVSMRNPLALAAEQCIPFSYSYIAELNAVMAMPVVSGASATFAHAVDAAYYTAYPNAPGIPMGWKNSPTCRPWAEAWIRMRALAERLGKWDQVDPMPTFPPGTPAPERQSVTVATRVLPGLTCPEGYTLECEQESADEVTCSCVKFGDEGEIVDTALPTQNSARVPGYSSRVFSRIRGAIRRMF